jgi:RNA polymerase sigma-54 factor
MLNLKLSQKLQQKLSPQQIQVIKMLEIPAMMLEQRIKKEMEDNPALEMEDDSPEEQFEYEDQTQNDAEEFSVDDYINEDEYASYKTSVQQTVPSPDDNKEIPFSVGSTFHEFLQSQIGLRNFDSDEKHLAEYLIGNIDEDGYMRRPLESVVDDMAFSHNIYTSDEKMAKVLAKIQQLDPPGVGARDLQECLVLQLKRKDQKIQAVANALAILSKSFDDFTKKHYDKLRSKHNISPEELRMAISEILKLNPKPGSSYSDPHNSAQYQVIVPDFILDETAGELELSLSSKNAPELKISHHYAEMLLSYKNAKVKTAAHRDAVSFVKQKLDSAKWFIDAIKQRQATLLGTMDTIIKLQEDFFRTGDEAKLKPMILKDIADVTGLDVSTVSRVANSKHIQTRFGIYPLKYFFSEGLQTESGDEVSSREIKSILQECIADEDKNNPLTDDKLCDILKSKGYMIARRTVAKYREQLNIPVGRLRKEA